MNTLLIESVIQETEKAIQVIIGARRFQDGEFHNVKVWFPKSQVRVEDNQLLCPEWLVEKKIEEVGNAYEFDCDGLMMVGLAPSEAPSKEEAAAKWEAFTQIWAQKEAQKIARAKARKNRNLQAA